MYMSGGLPLDDLRERVCPSCPCCFNIALLLAVAPPYRLRGPDETGRLVGGSKQAAASTGSKGLLAQ